MTFTFSFSSSCSSSSSNSPHTLFYECNPSSFPSSYLLLHSFLPLLTFPPFYPPFISYHPLPLIYSIALGGRKAIDEADPQPIQSQFSDEAKIRRKASTKALEAARPPISKSISIRYVRALNSCYGSSFCTYVYSGVWCVLQFPFTHNFFIPSHSPSFAFTVSQIFKEHVFFVC